MNRLPERVEAPCPNCGAGLVVSAIARKKRVQCPKCREVVSLAGEPEPAPAAGPSPEEFAELKARVERQAVLIEKLIARVMPAEDLPPVAPPQDGAMLSPGTNLRWLRRRDDDEPAGEAEQESVLLHNLRAMGQREVVVQSTAGDEEALRLGERLSAVFRQAGWTVQGPDPAPPSTRAQGLVLTAGQCPLPQAATATYMALKAAGFPIDSRLDAALRPDQSVLITGRIGRG